MADFFDKMLDGINKGVATVSTGSKTMMEKNKINTVIKNIDNERRQLAELLGNKIYQMCVENPEGVIPKSEVISICAEISSRYQQIEVQKQKIVALDAEMNQVRGIPTAVSPVPGVVCSCGQANNPGAKFCARCGNPLS